MTPRVCVVLGLVLLFSAAQAPAESRSVLILVEHKDDKPRVTIRSAEEKERKSDVSIDEACAVIKEMKGWGSIVHVFVVSERRLPRDAFKKLNAAINSDRQATDTISSPERSTHALLLSNRRPPGGAAGLSPRGPFR